MHFTSFQNQGVWNIPHMVKYGIAKFLQWLDYGQGNRGSSVWFPARAKHSSPKYSDCFSCPLSLLVNYYWGLFPHGQRTMHLITHVCYVLKLRRSGAITPLFICLHAIHTDNGLLYFWQIIYNRETDGSRDRERERGGGGESMHVQLPVLCLMISFKLFLS